MAKCALDCVEELRIDLEFEAIWAQSATDSYDASETTVPTLLKLYVVESTVGQHQQDMDETVFSALLQHTGQCHWFAERNRELVEAICALDQDSPHF